MTNYFKVYLTSKNGREKHVIKKKSEVMKLLNEANQKGYYGYTIVKRLKQGTDISVGRGMFTKECEVKYVDGLDTDWRIVGGNVVNWDKYKKAKEDEER